MSTESMQHRIDQLVQQVASHDREKAALQDVNRRHVLAAQAAQRGIQRRNRRVQIARDRLAESEALLMDVRTTLQAIVEGGPGSNLNPARVSMLLDRIETALRLKPRRPVPDHPIESPGVTAPVDTTGNAPGMGVTTSEMKK